MNGEAAHAPINPERVGRLETLVDHVLGLVSRLTERAGVADAEIENLKEARQEDRAGVKDLRDEVRALRHAIIILALSWAGGSLALAFAATQVFGG